VARTFVDKIGPGLGQRIVIEHRPGANGAIAGQAAAQAAPDGHTLLFDGLFNHTLVPLIQKLPYEAIKDFQPITLVFSVPVFLIVPKDHPARSAAELAAYGRTKPGGLSYGSQGAGSSGHILGTLYQAGSGAPMTHVPYKSGAQMQGDLVGGQFDFAFSSYSTSEPQKHALRFLAIASPARWSGLPDVPTMAEAGFPGVDFDTWFGIMAPRGTPGAIVGRLHQEFVRAAQDADIVRKLAARGLFVKTSTPGEMADMMSREAEKLAPLAKVLQVSRN